MSDREQMDAYAANKQAAYEKLALLIANSDIVVTHPQGWSEVIERKNNNHMIPYSPQWEELDPNSVMDFDDARSAKDIECLFKNTKRQYKDAMR